MLELPKGVVDEVVALAVETYPYESCGLLAGAPGGDVVTPLLPLPQCGGVGAACTPSTRATTCAPSGTPRPRAGRSSAWSTATPTPPAFPSPTDVAQAPDPAWHYAIVSLQHDEPALRSFRIVDETVTEEPISIT